MAAQYRLLGKCIAADSPKQITTNKSAIRFAVLMVDDSGPAKALLYDSVGAPVAGTEFAGMSVPESGTFAIHFDSCEGSFPISSGIYVEVSGTGGILYVYGA